jgi:PAS domain S-box-containing protein
MASIREIVIATDIEGRFIFLNDAAEGLIGRKWADVERHPLASVLKISDAVSREPLSDIVGGVLRSGSFASDDRDLELTAQTGYTLPIEVSGVPIRSEDGDVIGAVLTFRDCSERKRTEKELQRLFDAVHAEREWPSRWIRHISSPSSRPFADARPQTNAHARRERSYGTASGGFASTTDVSI